MKALVEHVDPTLATRKIVVLCDEDQAFINAVGLEWKGAEVVVCYWHKARNMRKPRKLQSKNENKETT